MHAQRPTGGTIKDFSLSSKYSAALEKDGFLKSVANGTCTPHQTYILFGNNLLCLKKSFARNRGTNAITWFALADLLLT